MSQKVRVAAKVGGGGGGSIVAGGRGIDVGRTWVWAVVVSGECSSDVVSRVKCFFIASLFERREDTVIFFSHMALQKTCCLPFARVIGLYANVRIVEETRKGLRGIVDLSMLANHSDCPSCYLLLQLANGMMTLAEIVVDVDDGKGQVVSTRRGKYLRSPNSSCFRVPYTRYSSRSRSSTLASITSLENIQQ